VIVWFAAAAGSHWWPLVVAGGLLRLLVATGGRWWPLVATGGCRWLWRLGDPAHGIK